MFDTVTAGEFGAGRKPKQHGFTLIESLVALVVLSVGMLGIGSLYVVSLQSERTALYRTQAVNLAGDMLDRIRANGTARDSYAMAAAADAPKEKDTKDCLQDPCSKADLAKFDLARWVAAVKNTLPSGDATVVVTKAASIVLPDKYRVIVKWKEGSKDGLEQYSYQADLQFIPVTL
jgi:type IV pilus assembly protein PilV